MKCVRCGKPLTKATVTVSTRTGPAAWGSVCAQKDGFTVPRATTRACKVVSAKPKPEPDTSQMELEFA
jgi:hypothetical protein